MSLDVEQQASRQHQEYQEYRAISVTAIVALALGLMSLPSLLFPTLLFLPVLGLVIGLYSARKVRLHRDELTGLAMARIGAALSAVSFLGGVTISTVVQAIEVPEGYRPIDFAQLQPDPRQPKLPVSPLALELDGKRVFVKGYIHPDSRSAGLKQFVLVPDMGTCCFGGQPKLTDMIEVTLVHPERDRVSYSLTKRKLGGILKVSKMKKPISGLDGVYYQLEADYVR